MTTDTITDLTTATPQEIDAELYPLVAQNWKLSTNIHEYRRMLACAIWPAEARRSFGRYFHSVHSFEASRYAVRLAELEALRQPVLDRIAEIDAEYNRRGGWSRYEIVNSRGKLGHLHYGWCSSFRPTTQTLLISDASGLSPDEVVGTFGETACTKCFKDAPVAGKVAV